jgi:hypothetical protein
MKLSGIEEIICNMQFLAAIIKRRGKKETPFLLHSDKGRG